MTQRIQSTIASILPALILLTGIGCLSTAAADELNGTRGKIHRVDLTEKSFEFLTETRMDPQTQEGKTRHTVQWTDQTRFIRSMPQEDFAGIEGQPVIRIEMMNPAQAKAAASGKPFLARNARVLIDPGMATGLAKDRSHLVARFTPDPDHALRGTVELNGKPVQVSLVKRNREVRIDAPANASEIGRGFWEATVYGKPSRDGFLLERAVITPLPDPYELDDPNLPRVLVVGDSISMNYHEAAKKTLAGKANYYRIDGNGGPSDRGVSSLDLWLGDYTRKGLHWDVIQFNHGLHDLKQPYDAKTRSWGEHQVSIAEYQNNLEKEIAILKKTGAKLIWCTTTPVPNSSQGKYARRTGEAAVYNQAALEVIRRHPEILVNDLHQTVSESKTMDTWRKGSDVHFWTEAEQEVLGQAVAAAILRAL